MSKCKYRKFYQVSYRIMGNNYKNALEKGEITQEQYNELMKPTNKNNGEVWFRYRKEAERFVDMLNTDNVCCPDYYNIKIERITESSEEATCWLDEEEEIEFERNRLLRDSTRKHL